MATLQQQEQTPVQQARPPKRQWDIKGYLNSPWLLLAGALIVGGIYLIAHPAYVTLAMNYPFSAVFLLAIPVVLFLVKLVINFFSVIEKWIKLQFERARSAKKGHFFELVTGVFMFVSVCEAGPFFNDIQHSVLGGALGYITVLAFDLIAVVCIDARRKELAKGGSKSGIYLAGVILCAVVSMVANLYSALLNFQAPTAQNFPDFLKSIAPYVGIMFPVMIVFLAFSRDTDIEIDDAETYRKQQQKRVDFLAARRELMGKVSHEMQQIELIKQREFFLKSWLFTKKKVQVVIEMVIEQVKVQIQSELAELKNVLFAETLKEAKASYQLQFEIIETHLAELKVQQQRIEDLEIELKKLKSEYLQLQSRLVQQPANQPSRQSQPKTETKVENKQETSTSLPRPPIELEAKRSGRFNKTQFVLDCLKLNSEMPSSEIKERAEKLQQSISDPIISMARNEFKNQQKLKEVNTGEFEKVEVGG